MKQSKYTIEEWLEATAKNRHPNGEPLEVVKIADGATVADVGTSGTQHFGSGGYSAHAEYAGNEPTPVVAESFRNDFIRGKNESFVMTASSVIYERESDCIGRRPRVFKNRAYVCS